MDIIFVFTFCFSSTIKLWNFTLCEVKSRHELSCRVGIRHICVENCDSDARYNVREVEQFPGKCRELSGSYPSTCSVIGLDHAFQLNSTKKIQTKNHGDLFTDVFRQVIFLQVVCVFLFTFFFTSSFTTVYSDIFFCFKWRLWWNTQTKSALRVIEIVLNP